MIELVAGFIVLALVVFLFMDVCLLVVGAIINDGIVSEAARAASIGLLPSLLSAKIELLKNINSHMSALVLL